MTEPFVRSVTAYCIASIKSSRSAICAAGPDESTGLLVELYGVVPVPHCTVPPTVVQFTNLPACGPTAESASKPASPTPAANLPTLKLQYPPIFALRFNEPSCV